MLKVVTVLALVGGVAAYHCYDQMCWGPNETSIHCDLGRNHCQINETTQLPMCLPHFDTTGIMCGDQCKCMYDARGKALCDCPNKYIIMVSVILIGIVIAGILWFIYFRCKMSKSMPLDPHQDPAGRAGLAKYGLDPDED